MSPAHISTQSRASLLVFKDISELTTNVWLWAVSSTALEAYAEITIVKCLQLVFNERSELNTSSRVWTVSRLTTVREVHAEITIVKFLQHIYISTQIQVFINASPLLVFNSLRSLNTSSCESCHT